MDSCKRNLTKPLYLLVDMLQAIVEDSKRDNSLANIRLAIVWLLTFAGFLNMMRWSILDCVICKVCKSKLESLGYPAANFGAHSLRAGGEKVYLTYPKLNSKFPWFYHNSHLFMNIYICSLTTAQIFPVSIAFTNILVAHRFGNCKRKFHNLLNLSNHLYGSRICWLCGPYKWY